MLEEAGCKLPNVTCACCRKKRESGQNGATYCYGDKNTKPEDIKIQITLCVNTGHMNQTYQNVLDTLTHEYQHAWDCCKARLQTCEERACSEIKAYDQGGRCTRFRGAAYRTCIVDHAVGSLIGNLQRVANGPCKGKTRAEIISIVNQQYASCIGRM